MYVGQSMVRCTSNDFLLVAMSKLRMKARLIEELQIFRPYCRLEPKYTGSFRLVSDTLTESHGT
jgi:hypothetical protein